MKFKEGTDLDAMAKIVSDTYTNLDKELSYLNNPHFRRNICTSPIACEFMTSFDIDSKDLLPTYANHPFHLAMVDAIAPYVAWKASFDEE